MSEKEIPERELAKYRKKQWLELLITAVFVLLLVAAYFISNSPMLQAFTSNMGETELARVRSMQWGGLVGGCSVGAFYIIYTVVLFCNPRLLKKSILKRTDERIKTVQQKSYSITCQVTFFVLVVGAIIAGNFSVTVALTLYFTLVVILAIYFISNLVFRLRN